MMMLSVLFWFWVMMLFFLLPNLLFIPAVRKAGFSAWWVVLSLIPVVGLVLLWLFAYRVWPAQPER